MLELINSAIAEKKHPSLEKVIRPTKTFLIANWNLRSDGLHHCEFAQATLKCDPRSDRPHQRKVSQLAQEPQNDFPRLIATSSNQNNHCREDSVDSDLSDDDGHDT